MILISMMVSSDTQDQIEEVYRIALDKKINWFNIQLLNYTTPETCDAANKFFQTHFQENKKLWESFCNPRFNEVTPDLIAGQINNIMAMRKSVPISVMGNLASSELISKYYFTLEPIRQDICVLPFTGMHIIPPGNAVFCIDYPCYEYGDISKNSLRSVWLGKRAADFRTAMIKYYKEHKKNCPQCQRCNWRFN